MKTRIVSVEETDGISIPRPLLEATGLKDEAEVETRKGCLVIRTAKSAREGWEDAFGRMAAAGDDKLVLNEKALLTRWDEEEWEW